MTERRDWDGEMNRFPIDDTTAEALLAGGLSPDDVPRGYAGLAGMIQAATGPTIPAEMASELLVVAAGVAAVRSAPTIGPTTLRRKSMLTKLRSAKVAAIAVTAVLATSGVAAAATGTLPPGAQTTVANTVAHVGISVPKPNSHANANALSHSNASIDHGKSAAHKPADQGANAKADFGQCTAFLATPDSSADNQATTSTTSGKNSSTAFADLITDHGGTVASATSYCKTTIAAKHASTPTSATKPTDTSKPTDTTKPTSATKPTDTGKPTSPGKSASHAPASTPNSGDNGNPHKP
jgi:chitinase